MQPVFYPRSFRSLRIFINRTMGEVKASWENDRRHPFTIAQVFATLVGSCRSLVRLGICTSQPFWVGGVSLATAGQQTEVRWHRHAANKGSGWFVFPTALMLRVSFSPAPECVDADGRNQSIPTPQRYQEHGDSSSSYCFPLFYFIYVHIYIYIYI